MRTKPRLSGRSWQIDAMKPQVDLLEHQLEALHAKHEEMSNNTDLLEARSETAKAQQTAGAIISGGKGTAAEKIKVMEAAGIRVAKSPADIGETLVAALGVKV